MISQTRSSAEVFVRIQEMELSKSKHISSHELCERKSGKSRISALVPPRTSQKRQVGIKRQTRSYGYTSVYMFVHQRRIVISVGPCVEPRTYAVKRENSITGGNHLLSRLGSIPGELHVRWQMAGGGTGWGVGALQHYWLHKHRDTVPDSEREARWRSERLQAPLWAIIQEKA